MLGIYFVCIKSARFVYCCESENILCKVVETKISCIYLWKWNNFVYSCERESIVYILLWKLKYFVYFCKSESILYTVVKVKVFGNIWQIATSALTQASFTDWKWNLTHRASFRNIYKKTSHGKFDRIKGKLILIISTVHHPSTGLRAVLSCILADWGQTEYS